MTLGNNREFRRIILQNRYNDISFVDEVLNAFSELASSKSAFEEANSELCLLRIYQIKCAEAKINALKIRCCKEWQTEH